VRSSVASCLLLSGCFFGDRGSSLDLTLHVPTDVQADYSEDAPGLLVWDLDLEFWGPGQPVAVAVICGEDPAFDAVVTGWSDLGCGSEAQLTAWIEPFDPALLADHPCGLIAGEPDGELPVEPRVSSEFPHGVDTIWSGADCDYGAQQSELTLGD
jgi:hypothetical protein